MHKIILSLTMVALLFMFGCGSSSTNQQQPVATTEKQDTAKPEAKTETKPATSEPVKTAENTTVPEAKPPVAAKGDWIFVLKVEGKIEPQDQEKVVDAVKAKWLQNKEYSDVKYEDYENKMANYEGKKVIAAELLYLYGEYEFSIRTEKIEKDGGDVAAKPIEEGPTDGFRGKDSIEAVLKDLRFMK